MNESSTSSLCLVTTVHLKKTFTRRLNAQRYLCDKNKLCLSFLGRQTAEHMDLFPIQILSPILPLGVKKRMVLVSQYSIPAQETVTPLLLKSKALSVLSCGPCSKFALAIFQWSVNSLQICSGWGGPRALAGRNVTWTPLHREAALRDGAFMHIVSGPDRKLTQQFKRDPAGENTCWRQWSCGGFWQTQRGRLAFAL